MNVLEALLHAHRDEIDALVNGAIALGHKIENVAIWLPAVGDLRVLDRWGMAERIRRVVPEANIAGELEASAAPSGRFWLVAAADGPDGGSVCKLISVERYSVPRPPAN